ncbi:MAG: hypothetical protein Q7S31_02950 [bacterium]|nr:hypothetical protein [bacterium]
MPEKMREVKPGDQFRFPNGLVVTVIPIHPADLLLGQDFMKTQFPSGTVLWVNTGYWKQTGNIKLWQAKET